MIGLDPKPRATRLVCTVGPACDDESILERMIRSGLNIARLNFSHGDHASHRATVERLRRVVAVTGREIALLQDLQGHKVRVGQVAGGGVIELVGGAEVRLGPGAEVTTERIGVDYADVAKFAAVGDHLFLDDGMLDLVVRGTSAGEVTCEVAIGGPLASRKGVIFPDSDLEFPLVNLKDLSDARFGVELGVDMMAMSFVRSATEILEMRLRLGEWGAPQTLLIAKIEDRQGVENVEEILQVADGILIARGDMGVSLPREQVPRIQARIIRCANAHGVPVITATQMLESMIEHHRPTRAEVTDVFGAVVAGSGAVMLSGETAAGRFPAEAVAEMDLICREAEDAIAHQKRDVVVHIDGKEGLHDRIAEAIGSVVERTSARCVIGCSLSGSTLRALSAARLAVPVFGIVPDAAIARELLLYRGLSVVVMPPAERLDELTDPLLERLEELEVLTHGDRVIVVAGEIDHKGRKTHLARVYVVDREVTLQAEAS